MRTAAFYCVHDDTRWLEASVESIYAGPEAIYFYVSERPWQGTSSGPEETLKILKNFPDPAGKIRIKTGSWTGEVEQRNTACADLQLDGFTHAFIIDADEIYDDGALGRLLDFAAARPDTGCWHIWFIHYWKSPYFRIDPPEKHTPPVLLKLGSGSFIEYRNCLSQLGHQIIPPEVAFCHHMSYARSDAEVLKKISTFSHAHQCRAGWFNVVWKAWDNDRAIRDLCPYNPGVFDRAVAVPAEFLPGAVKRRLETGIMQDLVIQK